MSRKTRTTSHMYIPLGGDLDAYPGMSSFGLLLRAARISRLQRTQFHNLMGLNFLSKENVFKLITFSPKKLEALATAFHLNDEVRMTWDPKQWWPFEGALPFDLIPWELRICKACSRSCYHSLLFQMPGVSHCPWHGNKLISRCDRCERPLLAGFGKGLPLLACPCGRDFVNYEETIDGDNSVLCFKRSIIVEYLAWAAESRAKNWLFAPEAFDPFGWQALNAMVARFALPVHIAKYIVTRPADGALILDQPNASVKNISPYDWMPYGSGLDKEHATLALLPKLAARPLEKIGTRIIEGLSLRTSPPNSQSQSKVRRKTPSRNTASASKSEVPALPLYPLGEWAFFDTGTLQRDTRRVLTRLCWLIDTRVGPSRKTPEIEGFAKLRSCIEDNPASSRFICITVLRILHRAYCDGLRVSIGRHVPEIYDSVTFRPRNRLPWVSLNYNEQGPRGAIIAWTRQRNTE